MNKIKEFYNKIYKALKTLYILNVVCKFKKTYGYYYYLCLKEFIKKLLKPKKMIAIKWRINPNDDFKYITYVENLNFKKCRGPILLENFINPQKFEFNVEKSITTDHVDCINDDLINIVYKPNSNFYYIEGGMLFIEDNNKKTLIKENFKQFRIDDKDWIDISNITYNSDCFIDFESNIFIPSTEKNKQLIAVCDNHVNYVEKQYSEFISVFRLI